MASVVSLFALSFGLSGLVLDSSGSFRRSDSVLMTDRITSVFDWIDARTSESPCSQSSSRTTDPSNDSKKPMTGSVVELSGDTITIEIRDEAPHFQIGAIDRQFSQNQLVSFLTAFYKSRKRSESKPDILVGSSPKRLIAGEKQLFVALKLLGKKHGFSIVRMPPSTGEDSHRALRRFSKKHPAK